MAVGFLSGQEVTLTNTSEIPMTYRLRVSSNEAEDGVGDGGEFEVTPKSGVLPPNYHQNIQVRVITVHCCESIIVCVSVGRFCSSSGEGIFD